MKTMDMERGPDAEQAKNRFLRTSLAQLDAERGLRLELGDEQAEAFAAEIGMPVARMAAGARSSKLHREAWVDNVRQFDEAGLFLERAPKPASLWRRWCARVRNALEVCRPARRCA